MAAFPTLYCTPGRRYGLSLRRVVPRSVVVMDASRAKLTIEDAHASDFGGPVRACLRFSSCPPLPRDQTGQPAGDQPDAAPYATHQGPIRLPP
jgi:hypothetical protein